MKVPIFFLLVLYTTNAAAFGISGAYERMFYWYAYQLDQASDGTKTIAKMCGKELAGGQSCNLRQFLTYIAANDAQRANARALPDTINAHNINADTAAGIIDHGHVNGLYTEYHVCEKAYNVPDLFVKVSQLIRDKATGKSVNDYPLDQILTSRKRVEAMRASESQRSAGDWLREKFDKDHVPTGDVPEGGRGPVTEGLVIETSERVCTGNNLEYAAVDLQAAGDRIHATKPSNAGESGFNLKTELRNWRQEELGKQNNHIENIQQIIKARGTILKSCSK